MPAPRALRLLALGLLAPVAACSPTGLLNSFIPETGFRVEKDVAYGDHPRQRLDVYEPLGLRAPAPVIVFFYGGSWQTGSKDRYLFAGQAFASAGAIVVIPDYRTWPEVMFPDFIEDGAQAVAWVEDNIEGFGGDPERISLMGHSAGAHIAAMLALDRSFLTAAGANPDRLEALIGLAGPYDFLPIRARTVKKIFAVEDRQQTQPITFVRPGAPRALLLHGDEDGTVLAKNSRNLAAALERAGVPVTLEIYEGIGHLEIVAALAAPLRWLADSREDVLRFLGLEEAERPR